MFLSKNKKVIFLVCLLLGIFQLSLSAESSLSLQTKADGYLEGSDFRSAAHFYRLSLDENPGNTRALLGAGRAFLALKDFNRSEQYFLKLLKIDPEDEGALIGMGSLYTEKGEYKKAREYFDKASSVNPGSRNVQFALGKYYLKQRKLNLAESYFHRLLRRNASHVDSLLALSEIELLRGRLDLSENYWNQASRIEPVNPELSRIKGELLVKKAMLSTDSTEKYNNLEQAGESLNSSTLQSSDKNSNLRIVWIKLLNGKDDEAIDKLKEMVEENKDDSKLHYFYAMLLSEKNQSRSQVAEHFGRSVALDPDDSIFRYGFENYILSNQEYFPPAGNIRKNLSRFHLQLSQFYFSTGKTESSYLHLNRGIQLDPDNENARDLLMKKILRDGNYQEYINELTRKYRKNPDDYKLHNRLEGALRQKKNYISYREDLLENEIDSNKKSLRTPTKIFVYDIEPENSFPVYPDASRLISSSIRRQLMLPGSIASVPEDVRQKIFDSIDLADPAGKRNRTGVFYHPGDIRYIEESESDNLKINYILHGNYRIVSTTIYLDLKLVEKNTSRKILEFKIKSSGKGAIYELGKKVYDKLSHLPYTGRILKVNADGLFLNLGRADHIEKGKKFRVPGKGLVTVEETDYFVSRAKPLEGDWTQFTPGEILIPE